MTDPLFYLDDGYSKICLYCNKRFGRLARLVGKPRSIDIEACENCVGKTVTKAGLKMVLEPKPRRRAFV